MLERALAIVINSTRREMPWIPIDSLLLNFSYINFPTPSVLNVNAVDLPHELALSFD